VQKQRRLLNTKLRFFTRKYSCEGENCAGACFVNWQSADKKTVRHSEAKAENSDVCLTAATATTASITASRRGFDQLPILAARLSFIHDTIWQFGIARTKGYISS